MIRREAATTSQANLPKTRKLIEWSPHVPSQFVVGTSADLRLYDIQISKGKKNLSANYSKFSIEDPYEDGRDKQSISLLGVNYELQLAKCLSWCLDPNEPDLIACGLPTGKVVLATFSPPSTTSHGYVSPGPKIIKDFVPKHSRACNCLAWNPVFKNQLAAGLDKVRGDFSTLVWDITYSSSSSSQQNGSPSKTPRSDMKPTSGSTISELANSEATVALSWIPNAPSCLVTGTGVKWLRIYDLRADLSAPQSVVAHSKSVHGVKFDPFFPTRLATFSEDGIIKLWDIRNFVEPIFSLNSNSKGLIQVEWCPTRSGIIAAISRDERTIKFWDIQDALLAQVNEKDESAPVNAAPWKVHDSVDSLSSLSWHPQYHNRMLTITNSGYVELVSLQQSIPLAWNPSNELSFGIANARYRLAMSENQNQDTHTGKIVELAAGYESDVSAEMNHRAIQGYALDIAVNLKIAEASGKKSLKVLWNWMQEYTNGSYSSSKEIATELFQGIHSIMKAAPANTKKITTSATLEKSMLFPIYVSAQRNLVLQICGWPIDKKDALEQALSKLEADGQFERAAALAVFHMEIRRAITSLTRASSANNNTANLKLVAMALAGFNDISSNTNMSLMSGIGSIGKSSSLWKELCLDPNIVNELSHPYLKASFAFLSADKNFKQVLDNQDLSILDRIAFAARFLEDIELMQYIENLINELTVQGSLEGVLLTGLDNRSVDLFQEYINFTADIQTPVLALAHVVPKKFKDTKVDKWVKLYSELLDTWQLWHERAKFDIARKENVPTQVYVRCNFCNQPLAMGMITSRRAVAVAASRSTRTTGLGLGLGLGSNANVQKQKLASCPGCKKPLPRCALCLLPFNCSIPNMRQNQTTSTTTSSPFDSWFTWCQSCRHGGHAKHMMEWFQSHSECPVTDCKCKLCPFMQQ